MKKYHENNENADMHFNERKNDMKSKLFEGNSETITEIDEEPPNETIEEPNETIEDSV